MPVLAHANLTVFVVSFGLYTLAIVAVGLYSARYARRSDEDYFLAGRSLGGWVAALSASASSESGWVTLGLVGWAFTSGVKAYWIIPGCLLGYAFNWFLLAARMSDRARALSALTLPDFFAFSFKERLPLLRTLSVIVTLVAMFLYVSAQFAAAGKAFAMVLDQADAPAVVVGVSGEAGDATLPDGRVSDAATPSDAATSADATASSEAGTLAKIRAWLVKLWPQEWGDYQYGVLLGGIIVLLYTVGGGFRAVCWTDFLQALLMVGTLVVFPIYLMLYAGGWALIETNLAAADPQLLEFGPRAGVFAFVGFLFGHGALGINFGYPGQPHVLVRFMALKDRRAATRAGVIAIIWGACVYWGAVTVGLFARAIAEGGEAWAQPMLDNPDLYKELGLALSAYYMLPSILAGLVLAAVLAAICSTADSQIVVAASAAANDLYARLFKRSGQASQVWVNRLTVAALGVLAMLSVLSNEVQVYQYVLTYGWAVLGAAFGPQVILLLLWRRASYAGCLMGMLTGFVVALTWPRVYDEAATGVHIYNLPLAFMAALIVNVVISALASRDPQTEPRP